MPHRRGCWGAAVRGDRVWSGYGVARHVAVWGDLSMLDKAVPVLAGPQVPAGAHDDFCQPHLSDTTASLFEPSARGLDQAMRLTGENGMPLSGTGDWNDGMNRVGEGGRVWLGWRQIATIDLMAPLACTRDPARAARLRGHPASVLRAIESEGWDGASYRRGTVDDGLVLGPASFGECQIDSIAQSLAVLSGAADPVRARLAMALLFAPPFDRTPRDMVRPALGRDIPRGDQRDCGSDARG